MPGTTDLLPIQLLNGWDCPEDSGDGHPGRNKPRARGISFSGGLCHSCLITALNFAKDGRSSLASILGVPNIALAAPQGAWISERTAANGNYLSIPLEIPPMASSIWKAYSPYPPRGCPAGCARRQRSAIAGAVHDVSGRIRLRCHRPAPWSNGLACVSARSWSRRGGRVESREPAPAGGNSGRGWRFTGATEQE